MGDLVLIGLCSVLALATSLWVIMRRWIRVNAQYPPGPRGLPIVGHLHMLGSFSNVTLANLSNIYGPLLSLRFGSLPVIIASSPAMAKLILHTHDKIFSGRPQIFSVLRNFNAGFPNIGMSPPDPFWKLARKLCFTELFSAKRLNYFKPLRAQELRNVLLSIFAAEGTPIHLREKLHKTSMNLISRMVVGKSLQEIATEIPNSEKIMETLIGYLEMMGMFNVGDYIPLLAWMDLQGLDKKSKKIAQITASVFQQLIDQRRSSRSSNNDPPHDLLDVLLASAATESSELQITDGHIRAIIMDMFNAGADSNVLATEWALAELLSNPPKLKALQEELDVIVGCSRLVEETDLPNLPYLGAVVNEVLRLHPIGPLLLPHMSMEPAEVSSYHISKNTVFYINTWAIHRDPNIWDNPLEFSPERFLDINKDALTQQCKYLPFGLGRRACPGATLALLIVQLTLANLVHAFTWITPTKPKLKERFNVLMELEDPLVIIPLPKLPKALLEAYT